jgi:hypothetical protein
LIPDLTVYDLTSEVFIGTFRGETLSESYDNQYILIEEYGDALDTYYEELAAYQDGLLTYQEDYLGIMIELWDDFIGVPRVEGQENVMSTLDAELPVAPVPPTISVEYSDPEPADFECLGNPCKASVPIAEDNVKSFGVFGLDGGFGFDYNYESADYFMHTLSDPDAATENFDDDWFGAMMHSETVCRPKVMYVTISVADKDYVPSTDDET